MSSAPEVIASAPPAPAVWTARWGSNVCAEYPRSPDDGLPTYATREECEEWVAKRSCQPGFRCYDGCNWSGCNARGDGMITTLLACDLEIFVETHFRAGTSKPVKEFDYAAAVPQLQHKLRPPERSLKVIGYAEANEAGGSAVQKQLALRRAQVVVKALVKHGLDAARVQAEAGDVERLRRRGRTAKLQVARLELEPRWSVRDDFEPSSPEYQEFCGVKSQRGE